MSERTEYSNWEQVPEHLKTRTALKKLGLRPKRGQEPVVRPLVWLLIKADVLLRWLAGR